MQIGLNSDSFSKLGYSKYWGEDSFKMMKEFGYSAVDFSVLGNHETEFYKIFYGGDAETRKAMLLKERGLIEEAGLKVHQAHAPCISLSRSLTEEEISGLMDKIKIAIEGCYTLGCKYLVVHPFMPNGWSDRGTKIAEDTFVKNVNYLRELSDFAERYGITVCLENMPCIGFSISTPEEVLAVLKAVDRENVKMCFDTGHITAFSYDLTVGNEIRKCGEAIKVLHVHDNHGRADQHNFPGMGMIDWTDAMNALKEIGFDGVFSLELVFPDKFSEPVFKNSCRLAADMAYEIVNGLLV